MAATSGDILKGNTLTLVLTVQEQEPHHTHPLRYNVRRRLQSLVSPITSCASHLPRPP